MPDSRTFWIKKNPLRHEGTLETKKSLQPQSQQQQQQQQQQQSTTTVNNNSHPKTLPPLPPQKNGGFLKGKKPTFIGDTQKSLLSTRFRVSNLSFGGVKAGKA